MVRAVVVCWQKLLLQFRGLPKFWQKLKRKPEKRSNVLRAIETLFISNFQNIVEPRLTVGACFPTVPPAQISGE